MDDLIGHEWVTWVGMGRGERARLLSQMTVDGVSYWWVAREGEPPVTQRREYLRLWEEPKNDVADCEHGGSVPAGAADGGVDAPPGHGGGAGGAPEEGGVVCQQVAEVVGPAFDPDDIPEWDDIGWVPEDSVF